MYAKYSRDICYGHFKEFWSVCAFTVLPQYTYI